MSHVYVIALNDNNNNNNNNNNNIIKIIINNSSNNNNNNNNNRCIPVANRIRELMVRYIFSLHKLVSIILCTHI